MDTWLLKILRRDGDKEILKTRWGNEISLPVSQVEKFKLQKFNTNKIQGSYRSIPAEMAKANIRFKNEVPKEEGLVFIKLEDFFMGEDFVCRIKADGKKMVISQKEFLSIRICKQDFYQLLNKKAQNLQMQKQEDRQTLAKREMENRQSISRQKPKFNIIEVLRPLMSKKKIPDEMDDVTAKAMRLIRAGKIKEALEFVKNNRPESESREILKRMLE